MPGQGETGRSCSFHHDAAQTSGPRGNLPARRKWGLARGCEKSVVEMLQDVHQQLLDKDEEIEELKATWNWNQKFYRFWLCFFCGTTKKGCRHASNIRIPINSLAWGQDSGLERCIGATWTCQNHTSSHLMPGVFSNEALSKVRRLAVRHVRCHSKFDWDSTQIYNPFQFQYWKVRFAAIPFSTPILPGKNHTLTTLKWQWMKRTRRCYGIRKWLGHQRAWYELLELLFGGFIDLAMLDD